MLESWHVDAVIVELDLLCKWGIGFAHEVIFCVASSECADAVCAAANGGDLQAELLGLSGQRTVPNIYISGHHVGGCDGAWFFLRVCARLSELCIVVSTLTPALLAAEKSGKLKTLLDGAGVHYKQPLA